MKLPTSAMVTTTAITASMCLTSPLPATAAHSQCSAVQLYWHRGDQTTGATENSLGALGNAAQEGYGFETDLRTTANGKVVVMHDPTTDRTTSGSGFVNALTSTQIKEHPMNDGSQVPFLIDALGILVRHPQVSAMLELKSDAMGRSSLTRLRKKVNARGLRDRVNISSFDGPLLRQFQRVAPRFHTSMIRDHSRADWAPADFLPFRAVHIRAEQLPPRWVHRAHRIGLPLVGRNTRDETAWAANVDAGVNAQVTDSASDYSAWCRSG